MQYARLNACMSSSCVGTFGLCDGVEETGKCTVDGLPSRVKRSALDVLTRHRIKEKALRLNTRPQNNGIFDQSKSGMR